MVAIDGGELGRARGGPHCMTMALHREADDAG
jgi:arginine deiminase